MEARDASALAASYCAQAACLMVGAGNQAINVEQAIDLYAAARDRLDPAALPALWARSVCGLAFAYARRAYGSRADGLARAVALLSSALVELAAQPHPAAQAYLADVRAQLLAEFGALGIPTESECA